MSYTLLKDLYYKDSQKHHSLYKERFESPYAHHINFNIGDSPAFFVITPEITQEVTGSSPVVSTKKTVILRDGCFFAFPRHSANTPFLQLPFRPSSVIMIVWKNTTEVMIHENSSNF